MTGQRQRNKIGSCVSGQCVQATLNHVKRVSHTGHLHHKIILLVGTNDVLVGTEQLKLRTVVRMLLRFLTIRSRRSVLVCTIPPFPRLWKCPMRRRKILNLNHFLEKDVVAINR
ncbi:uncharacterized protein LOC134536549 [Bacillus rossius redtenbacheri]|uniref:uncharacterized protein LOC134536549 n=1 Tax=Bacillus rossius redtenbacheri TaxID=93214 RepID=UPI002FDD968F